MAVVVVFVERYQESSPFRSGTIGISTKEERIIIVSALRRRRERRRTRSSEPLTSTGARYGASAVRRKRRQNRNARPPPVTVRGLAMCQRRRSTIGVGRR